MSICKSNWIWTTLFSLKTHIPYTYIHILYKYYTNTYLQNVWNFLPPKCKTTDGFILCTKFHLCGILILQSILEGVPLLSHYHINSAMRYWERHFLKYLHFYLFSASAYNSLPSPTWQSSVWTFWLWSLRAGALFEQDASEVEVLEVEVELRYADAAIPESRNF